MTEDARQDLRLRLGRVGLWASPPERFGLDAAAVAVATERAGFGSAWIGGGNTDPDAFQRLERWLRATERIVVAPGIASIWARPPARAYTARYLQMPNYTSSLSRLGFGQGDFAGGGSDRLVEAIVPHGPDQVVTRVRDHLRAGADHVVLQPLGDDGNFAPSQIDALAETVAEFRTPA